MKLKKVVMAVLCAAMVMTTVVSTSAGENPKPAEYGTGGEIKIGSTDPKVLGHFDTTCALDANYCGYSMDLVFDYILYRNPDTDEFASNILTSWEWDDAYQGVILQVKDGVKFSTGDPLTGDDIKYTLEKMSSSFMNIDMKIYINIDGIEVSEDGLTVKIPFNMVYGAWKDYLCGNTAVHSRAWEEANGGTSLNFDDPSMIVGSGPYKVTEYVVDSYAVFEKRNDWWMEGQQPEGTSSFDKITVVKYNDVNTMMIDYEMGSIDCCIGINVSDYDRIMADESLGKAGRLATHFVSMINLNADNTALKDKNLREAIAYAVDWAAVCDMVYGSLGTFAGSTLPRDSFAFVDGYTYEYNPEKARQIVDENGLAGTELTWVVTPDLTGTIAELVQQAVAQVGITIKLDERDMATATMIWMKPDGSMAQLDGSSFSNLSNDPQQQYKSCNATSMFVGCAKSDALLNAALQKGMTNTDQAIRTEAYQEVQKIIYDEVYCIPIAEWYSAYCYNTATIAWMSPLDQSMPLLRNIIPAAK
ncbi:MAG: ABC transporter substrate-binding protein [Parasporobacterium sp.]|nr:ABC transporter substrate-binding protein [Parasporobacterium sp.]